MNAYFLTSMCATILAMAVFVGCTSNTETTPSSESKGNISEAETQKEDDGNEKTIASIPDDFPSDIYVVDGAKVIEFKEIGGKKNLILDYPASDSDDFVESYQNGMSEQGWTVVASSKLPIGTITNFSKDDRKCTISVAPPKDEVIKVAIVLTSD